MRQNNFTPIIILALNNYSSEDDIKALSNAGIELAVPLMGSYKGNEERSYMLSMSDHGKALVVAREHNQESILTRYSDGSVYLYYLDTFEQEYLGQFEAVSESEAKSQDSWTYRPDLDQYYIVRMR